MAITAAEVLGAFRKTGQPASQLGGFASAYQGAKNYAYAGIDSMLGGILPGGVKPGLTSKIAGVGLGLYGAEQIAELLGVRGGAGFIGARPGMKKRRGYGIISKRAMKTIRKASTYRKQVKSVASKLGLHYTTRRKTTKRC